VTPRGKVSRGGEAVAPVNAFNPATLDEGGKVALDASTCAVKVVCEGCGAGGPITESGEEGEPIRGVREEPGGILHERNVAVGREKSDLHEFDYKLVLRESCLTEYRNHVPETARRAYMKEIVNEVVPSQ
jgi:hypothetical protein